MVMSDSFTDHIITNFIVMTGAVIAFDSKATCSWYDGVSMDDTEVVFVVKSERSEAFDEMLVVEDVAEAVLLGD